MSGDYNFLQHDVGIVNQAGEVIGLMLVKDKNDAPVYLTSDDDYIADPIRGQSNPNKELPPFIQDDWRGGFGLKFADSSDPKRYHYGTNVDMRFRNEGRSGPLATGITPPSYPASLTDGGFEVWAGGVLTNWSETLAAAHTLAASGTTPQEGTYCARVTKGGTGGAESYLDQSPTWSDDYRGTVIIFRAYGRVSSAGSPTVRVGIQDNAGTTWSSTTNTTGWVEVTATRTINASATYFKLRVNLTVATISAYAEVDAGTARIPTLNKIIAQADFNGVRYVAHGTVLFKLNATQTALTYVTSFDTDITNLFSSAVSGTAYLFICLGWSHDNWQMNTNEAFLESDLTGAEIKHMVLIGETFWASDTNNTIKYTANPLNGGTNWAAGKTVGNDTHDIVDLVEYGGLLYIKKEDRPYYKDSSGDIQVLTNETEHLGGTNDQPFYVWHSILFMPYGEQGLLTYNGTGFAWISPSLYSTSAGDFVGEVRALAGDDQWLYVVLEDGADVQLMAVRKETVDGVTDWRWHPLAELASITGCASLGLTSTYKKRLYVGSSDSAKDFTWYPVTTKYGDIDSDTDYKYQTNGYLYTSWLDLGYRGDIKAFIKQILTFSHAYDADIYFSVYYRLWGETSFTNAVGDFDGASGVRTETKYIDVANEPASTFIQFRIQFKTNDTAKTPILNISDLRAILYPSRRNLIYCLVLCADGLKDKNGTDLASDTKVIRTTLNYAKNTETYPVGFRDINGDTKTVRFLSVDPYSKVTKSEAGRNPEEEYRLVLQEVTLS